MTDEQSQQAETPESTDASAARRQPCPCGSGKKFKNCHEGREAELSAIVATGGGEAKAAAQPGHPAQAKAAAAGGPPAKQRFGPPPARQSGTRGASTKAHRRV